MAISLAIERKLSQMVKKKNPVRWRQLWFKPVFFLFKKQAWSQCGDPHVRISLCMKSGVK